MDGRFYHVALVVEKWCCGLLRKNLYTVQNSSVLHKKSSNIPLRLWCRLMLNPYLPQSVPVDLALTIAKERLQQDQNLSERSSMSVSNIMKLVDFVLLQ